MLPCWIKILFYLKNHCPKTLLSLSHQTFYSNSLNTKFTKLSWTLSENLNFITYHYQKQITIFAYKFKPNSSGTIKQRYLCVLIKSIDLFDEWMNADLLFIKPSKNSIRLKCICIALFTVHTVSKQLQKSAVYNYKIIKVLWLVQNASRNELAQENSLSTFLGRTLITHRCQQRKCDKRISDPSDVVITLVWRRGWPPLIELNQ